MSELHKQLTEGEIGIAFIIKKAPLRGYALFKLGADESGQLKLEPQAYCTTLMEANELSHQLQEVQFRDVPYDRSARYMSPPAGRLPLQNSAQPPVADTRNGEHYDLPKVVENMGNPQPEPARSLTERAAAAMGRRPNAVGAFIFGAACYLSALSMRMT